MQPIGNHKQFSKG